MTKNNPAASPSEKPELLSEAEALADQDARLEARLTMLERRPERGETMTPATLETRAYDLRESADDAERLARRYSDGTGVKQILLERACRLRAWAAEIAPDTRSRTVAEGAESPRPTKESMRELVRLLRHHGIFAYRNEAEAAATDEAQAALLSAIDSLISEVERLRRKISTLETLAEVDDMVVKQCSGLVDEVERLRSGDTSGVRVPARGD